MIYETRQAGSGGVTRSSSNRAHWQAVEKMLDTVVLRQRGGFGRHECEPGWEWSPTCEDYAFWFVIAGTGSAWLNGVPAHVLGPGSLALLRPGDNGHFRQNPRDRLTVLYRCAWNSRRDRNAISDNMATSRLHEGKLASGRG